MLPKVNIGQGWSSQLSQLCKRLRCLLHERHVCMTVETIISTRIGEKWAEQITWLSRLNL